LFPLLVPGPLFPAPIPFPHFLLLPLPPVSPYYNIINTAPQCYPLSLPFIPIPSLAPYYPSPSPFPLYPAFFIYPFPLSPSHSDLYFPFPILFAAVPLFHKPTTTSPSSCFPLLYTINTVLHYASPSPAPHSCPSIHSFLPHSPIPWRHFITAYYNTKTEQFTLLG